MANPLTLTLPMPADVALETGMYGAGAVIRVQTATADTGPFADVTGAGSTPTIPIVSGTDTYAGRDPAGSSSSWYRTRIENVGATRVSEWSEVFQAQGSSSTAVGTYAKLAPVKVRLGRTNDDDDELLQKYCDQVNQQIETRLGAPVCPVPSATYVLNGFDAVDGGRTMLIPQGIRTLTLVRVAVQTNAPLATIPSTDYFVLPPPLQRIPRGAPGDRVSMVDWPVSTSVPLFWPGYGNVELTMSTGWDAIPDDLADCGETTVVRAFQARRTGQGDVVGNDATGRAIISRILAAEWQDVIARYRPIAPRASAGSAALTNSGWPWR